MLTKERLALLEQTLEALAADKRKVIVEGRNDRAALRELGVTNVATLERAGLHVVETLGGDAIVLTDFDSKGRQLASRLRELLTGIGLGVDMTYRREILRYSGVKAVEELPARIRTMKKESEK